MPYKDREKYLQYQRDYQARQPKKGKPEHWHVLSNVDKDALTATCSRCGPTELRDNGGGQLRCRVAHMTTMRNANRKSRYGVTPKQFEQLLVDQDGRCRICSVKLDAEGVTLVVDHCHATGRVRGLLCWSCNVALGHFKDDIARLAKAIEYLAGSCE